MGIRSWLSETLATREDDAPPVKPQGSGVMPPAREATPVTADRALSLSALYRAVQIHTTAAMQISLDAWRGREQVDQALARRPSVYESRSAWIEQLVADLATMGEAFLWKTRGADGSVISLDIIDPLTVSVWLPPGGRRPLYGIDGRTWGVHEIAHLRLMRRSGQAHGLGPIQAAREDIGGALDVRGYGAGYFERGDVPNGILSTDQTLSGVQAAEYKRAWTESGDSGVRVIGSGLRYSAIRLNPADAQWLESRAFSTVEMARLMGVPASLMLVTLEGSSSTYANVEQEWIAYTRFTLMRYLREIEEAVSDCLPRGQECRFNLEALLRSDTKSRYDGYEIGLRAGWLTVDEIRAIEGLPPLAEKPAPAPAPAPAPDPAAPEEAPA